jgi:pyrroline-5-carboxylate reductase
VLSIVAGASIRKLAAGLKHRAIVRSMPNTPGQIGEGITVWTASHETSDKQRAAADRILGALGRNVFVEDESYLDMATALSGTGPAYVFLFMEALIDAGVHLGFPRYIAEQLVLQTLKGSAAFYERASRHPADLRNQVTSPGGTSAEALYYLEKAGFRTAISRAVWAAYQRSLELGKEKPVHLPESHVEEQTD